MKNLLHFLWILCSLTTIAQNNAYQPMLLNGNEWNISMMGCGMWTDCYQASKDTVFNNTTYQVITSVTSSYDYAYLRENVATQQVFMYTPYDSTETLLFDFSLQTNDVFQSNTWGTPYSATVINTDLITLLDNSTRKRLSLSVILPFSEIADTVTWVEGIGAISQTPFSSVDDYGFLNCFHQKNGNSLWIAEVTHGFEGECECPLPPQNLINALPTNETKLTVQLFPNPINNFLHLQLPNSTSLQVCVINANGQTIAQYPNVQNTLSIDTQRWAAGIYYVLVRDGQKTISQQKIVKP
ncbi:MAG TPA: T9SS type A sorting domain-containing protein [Chitinophagales bacterium]|nr:T9SS type A sorting domain-containing protein [Chitinophagales bacterium]HNL06368.1 T9SS type A sorting domain-containing protein [Chitinophagales bacterium]